MRGTKFISDVRNELRTLENIHMHLAYVANRCFVEVIHPETHQRLIIFAVVPKMIQKRQMSNATDTKDSATDQDSTHLANTIPDDTVAVEVSGTTSNSDTGTKDAPEVAKMAPEGGSSTRPTAPITHVNTT